MRDACSKREKTSANEQEKRKKSGTKEKHQKRNKRVITQGEGNLKSEENSREQSDVSGAKQQKKTQASLSILSSCFLQRQTV